MRQRRKILSIYILLLHQVVISQNSKPYPDYNHKNHFVENKGQIVDQYGKLNDDVLYLLNTSGLNVHLRKDGFSYDTYEIKQKENCKEDSIALTKGQRNFKQKSCSEYVFHRVDFTFMNSNPNTKIELKNPSREYYNYYNIPHKKDGVIYVKQYKYLLYKNIYPNIDVEFFVPDSNIKPVEYNFILHEGADVSDIKIKVEGANTKEESGNIEIDLIHGKLREVIPKSWIQNETSKLEKTFKFIKIENRLYGFSGANVKIKKNEKLIIDPTPVRLWGTYFGGSEDENNFNGIVKTSENNIYIAGYTSSPSNIATAGAYQTNIQSNEEDGFIAKFDDSGDLIWSTYLGGERRDFVRDLDIDNNENIYCVGETLSSSNIATIGAFQEVYNDWYDGFIMKFDSDGIRHWGTYYGGDWIENISRVKVDNTNQHVYIAGTTSSNNGISTPGSFKEIGNVHQNFNEDAFLVKLSTNGDRVWGTYYGGSGHDSFNGIDIDSNGDIVCSGTTSSFQGISTPGAYQVEYNYDTLSWNDSFIVKFNSAGQRLFGTYYGGTDYDVNNSVKVDSNNNILISGYTRSNVGLTMVNSYQPNFAGGYDSYLAMFDSSGNLLWNTYYGGDGLDGHWGMNDITFDNSDDIYLFTSGNSNSDISTPDAFQEYNAGGYDMYIIKFSNAGERLWGTYYGGSGSDYSGMIAEKNGDIYITGFTYSLNGITTPGAYQETYGGNRDTFLVKFKDCFSSISATATESVCIGDDIQFLASGGISYAWSGPNGFISNAQNPVINNADINHQGEYTVFIESAVGCDDTKTFNISVSQTPIANTPFDIKACENELNSGISTLFDTSMVENLILNGQSGVVISYFDSNGNELPNPLPNPMTNTVSDSETISVRIADENNLGCYVESEFYLIVNTLPLISDLDDLIVCDDNNDGYHNFDTSGIETTLIGGQTNVSLTFFDGNGNSLPNPLPNPLVNSVQNIETITARITNNDTSCYSETTFDLVVKPNPIAHSIDALLGCDDNNDGISEYFNTFNIESQVLNGQTGMSVSYFDQSGNELPSPLPNPYENSNAFNELITVRVTDNNSSCYAETILLLQTVTQPNISQPENLYACDHGNGYAEFDTSNLEQQLIGNQTGLTIKYYDSNSNPLPSPLPILFQNTEPFSQTISIRVEDASNPICYSETSFDLIVNGLPAINLEDEYFICNLEPSILLNVNHGYNSYNWLFEDGTLISSTNSGEITEEGNYTLTVTQILNGITCENSFEFSLIRSVLPEIQYINFGELGNNYIEIIASGDGDFEYSIDGINYQNGNYFSNIQGGIYTVFIRDKDGCGQDSEEVTVIDYPKFFTPNDDGFNDFWQIKGIVNFPNSETLIFDRFGKLLAKVTSSEIGWNGKYNGKQMISNDYWFRTDLGNGRTFTGHFSLKR